MQEKEKMDGKLADRVIRPIIAFVDKVRLAVIGHSIGKSPTLFASRDVKNRDNRNREHRAFGETGIIVLPTEGYIYKILSGTPETSN